MDYKSILIPYIIKQRTTRAAKGVVMSTASTGTLLDQPIPHGLEIVVDRTEDGAEDGAEVSLLGELDVVNGKKLLTEVFALVASGCINVDIDLNGITYMDSTGFRILLEVLKRLRENNGKLRLICDQNARLVRTFETVGVKRIFDFIERSNATVTSPR